MNEQRTGILRKNCGDSAAVKRYGLKGSRKHNEFWGNAWSCSRVWGQFYYVGRGFLSVRYKYCLIFHIILFLMQLYISYSFWQTTFSFIFSYLSFRWVSMKNFWLLPSMLKLMSHLMNAVYIFALQVRIWFLDVRSLL